MEGRARVMRRAANGDDGPCIATKTWFQFSRSDGLWIHGLRKKKRCVFLRGADGWMDFGRAQKNNVRSADFFFAGPLKMGAFLRAKHNNRGDPDHQNRTRPRARYVLALCAAALSSVGATKNYDGKQAEIAENRSISAGIGRRRA